jgi:hypothetical protein
MGKEEIAEFFKFLSHLDGMWAFFALVTTVLIWRLHLIVRAVMSGMRGLALASVKKKISRKYH